MSVCVGGCAVLQEGELQAPAAPKRIGGLKFTKFSNAYMLVYVRVSDWPRVMVPVTKDHIAPYLRQRLEVGSSGLTGMFD